MLIEIQRISQAGSSAWVFQRVSPRDEHHHREGQTQGALRIFDLSSLTRVLMATVWPLAFGSFRTTDSLSF